ncbi:MAG: hypothetical protein JWN72_2393 [Thermoleophilia bacterium]|nr:hypothetical protein [Thermoleophilia bacterium]
MTIIFLPKGASVSTERAIVNVKWNHVGPLVHEQRGVGVIDTISDTPGLDGLFVDRNSRWIHPEPRVLGIPFMQTDKTVAAAEDTARGAAASGLIDAVDALRGNAAPSTGTGAKHWVDFSVKTRDGGNARDAWQARYDLDQPLPAGVSDALESAKSLYRETTFARAQHVDDHAGFVFV